MTEPLNVVSVSRTIPIQASKLFSVLADPGRHPEIDGSGMVAEARDPRPLRGVGDAFVMSMRNDEMGGYEMTNHVAEYELDRRISWEPVLSAASRPEDVAEIGVPGRQRWSFTLVPDGEDATRVTETYDCRESPAWLQKAVRGGQRWLESMTVTLERLASVASAGPPIR